jgi:hypothetical protein
MVVPNRKSEWIIGPNSQKTIVFEGMAPESAVTPASEKQLQLNAEDLRKLNISPDFAGDKVVIVKCGTVGPMNCPTVTVIGCLSLVRCTGVTGCTHLEESK